MIGGGPAGLATALAARQRGLDVTVADSLAPPIDKPCGEGLMPDGVAALRRLGVNLPAIAGQPFRGIRFVSSELSVEATFPSGTALGVRRTNLHRIMVEHAEAAGVRFLWRTVGNRDSGPWSSGEPRIGSRPLDRWCGWRQLESAPLGQAGSSSAKRTAVCVPQALQDRALERFHGIALGPELPAVCHSGWS